MTVPSAQRLRRVGIAAGLVLAALTALAVWISGRWLERPHVPPDRDADSEKASPAVDPTEKRP